MEQRRLELVFAGRICRGGGREHACLSISSCLQMQGCWQMPGERHAAEKTAWDQCGGLDCGASSQAREPQA